ncbi:CO7A1 protein, partial [Polypterus senegalus]|nr:CO7A1 protein [Polypterus senegalus]
MADIVFLVDESWSAGDANFQIIKDFINGIIGSFKKIPLGKEGIRFGVTVYSDKPRMKIALTDYVTIEEVLVAVRDLPYEGGNTKTGEALKYLMESVFSFSVIRDDAPKIAILITDGKSADSVEDPAMKLQNNGITAFAVGIKNADKTELKKIVSDPYEEHMLYAEDFNHLSTLLPKVTRRVCFTASEPPRPVKQISERDKIIGPKDLVVNELSHSSLRLTWTPATGDVAEYQLVINTLSPSGALASEEQKQIILNGNDRTTLVTDLMPNTEYLFTIFAVYADTIGDSTSIKAKTMKLIPVQNLILQNATTDTIQVRWTRVRGASGYRLTWSSSEGYIENVNLGESYQFYMIQGLHPGSDYTVTINPIFGDIEGPVTTGVARTCDTNRKKNAKLLSTTNYNLRNLVYDTEYVLSLYVLFGSIVGPGITATARTSPLGYVSNFKITSYTSTSIDVAWSAIVGATEYKISWHPSTDNTVLNYHIDGLHPETDYTVSIHAVYGNSEGPPIMLSQYTASTKDIETIQSVKDLKVIDIGVDSFKLSWKKTAGVSGYRITWAPFHGGTKKSSLVSSDSTFFTISDLLESSAYTIQVSSVARGRESSPVLLNARTLGTNKITGDETVLSTKATSPPPSAIMPSLHASLVTRAAVATVKRKVPTTTEAASTLKSTTMRPTSISTTTTSVPSTPEPFCGKVKADIVFLVDESSSIGSNNFDKLKSFLFRVAVVHYSDEPRTEFPLNQYHDRNSILRAIRGVKYGGGNTKTGRGIGYILRESFQPSAGMRQNVPHMLVLITDGKAQDDVSPPARVAHALGIHVLAVGVANADIEELKKIVFPGNYQNIFYASTFDDFPSIERELIETMCKEVSLKSGIRQKQQVKSTFFYN